MNELCARLLGGLARTTLLLAAAAAIVQMLLWATRSSSPKAHRVCWFLVLVQGWLWLRVPVAIPYYEAATERGAWASEQRAHLEPDIPVQSEPRPGSALSMEPEEMGGWGPAQRASRTSDSRGKLRSPPATHDSGFQQPALPSLFDMGQANWAVLLAAVWLAGMGVMAGRWSLRYVRFVRGLPRGRDGEEAWVRQWQHLLAAEHVRRVIPLRMTARLGPMLCRLPSRWELLLPIDLWRTLPPEPRSAVLRHELAHLKRHDTWKSLAVRLLALPHWFNPAAWWAVRKFDEAAEWACDGSAAGADREHAVGYARTLVELGAPSLPRAACGPAAQGHGLTVRVRRLLSPGTEEDSVMKRLLLITIAMGLVTVCLLRFELVAKEAGADMEVSVPLAEEEARETNTSVGVSGVAGEVEISGLSVGGGPKTAQPAARSARLSAKKAGAERYEELGGEAGEAAVSSVREKVPLRSLRYDGKSFEEWQTEWKTELKPERRAEAINAFAAFGASGYGEEAAEAILEVMRGLEMQLADANFSSSDFQKGSYVGTQLVKMSAIAAFLHVRPDFRIPPDDAVRVLSRELNRGNRNGRLFAVFVLRNMSHEAEGAIPALRETFEKDEDATVRCFAYLALSDMLAGFRMPASALRDLIDAEPQALGQVLQALVPAAGCPASSVFQPKRSEMAGFDPDAFPHDMRGYLGPRELRPDAVPLVQTLIAALDGDNTAARCQVIAALLRIGPEVEGVEGVVPALVRASEDAATRSIAIEALGSIGPEVEGVVPALIGASENPATRSEAIRALARIGPEVEQVVPAMVRAFEKGAVDDRMTVLQALKDFLHPKPRALGMPLAMMPPGGYEQEYSGLANPDLSADDAKHFLLTLIQTLDPRNPADLRMVGHIYARFRPLVPEARLVLEKAAKDEDEEVRRTAEAVLEWAGARIRHAP